MYAQCTSALQCTPYSRAGPVECIDGQCCTGNDLDINYPDPYQQQPGGGAFDPYQNGGRESYMAEQSEGDRRAQLTSL